MAYLRQYQAMGDPSIFGAIARGVGKALHLGGGLVPGVGGVVGKFGGALSKVGAKIPKGAKVGLGIGAAAGAGALGAGALGHMMGGQAHRRHRRMNAGNIKALRRSMRRVQSFAKLAHQTISFTHRVRMKKHRRK